ncbi:MAG: glycosyl transferase [Ignavibacteriales bacterium CG12_big_fil_rev_8_21_14_0_65_30_8]|nr:MAG: glycosyl transferase [Ignavibacteriales bacterium CG12_big_fil_rev_8_21_14_0_65_30_8]
MTLLAPICLFVYKRLDLTKKTVTALLDNLYSKESELFIFSDAAKDENDILHVNEVRNYINTIEGFKKVHIINRENNLGLAESIIKGVTEIINAYGKVIVLEDDLITSKYFLQFMNEGLEKFENENRVISIHGYVYPIKNKLPETFFLKGTDCWGWATWKDQWDTFEKDGKVLLNKLKEKKLSYYFDYNGTTNNIKMLKRQINGEINSWAIRWHASAFLQNKLTLNPGKSLVKNIGVSGDSTHMKKTLIYDTDIYQKPIELINIPIEENILVKKEIEKFFISIKPNFIKRYYKKIKFLLGNY